MAGNDAYPWSAGFRSLAEEHDYRIDEIDGQVPAGLRGTLFRNGSGRNELGGQWFAHWFDGDGMISAIRFDDSGIHYRNRYVATENYRDETRAGRIVHRGFGKMRPGGVLANAFRQPANVSNTSVVMDGERLLSLWEGGPPFGLDPATLDTRGIETFGGALKAFSAHPKIDPATGELFNFGIDYGARTTLTPYRLDKGVATRLPPVTLPYPVMNHDFVLTRNYLAFCLGPILVSPLAFLLGFKSFDGALHWEGKRADPDPADSARRTRHAAHHRDRPVLPVPFRQRLRGGRRAGPRPRALSRLPHDRPGAARLLEVRMAGARHGSHDPPARRPRDRQGREPDLQERQGQRVPAHQSGLVRQALPLRLYRLQSRRQPARPAAATGAGSISRPARSRGTISVPTAIPASPSSSPHARTARRMTASWSPWCSTPRGSAPTSSASTRAISPRGRCSRRGSSTPCRSRLHGTFTPRLF